MVAIFSNKIFLSKLLAVVSLTVTIKPTLDARGLLARQRRGASERVVLVGERPLAQAVKS